MSTFSVCGLSNIQVTQNAIPLAFNFCDCPAALDVLNKVEVPLTVQVKPDSVLAASMEPLISSNCKFRGALITIAENHPRDFQTAVFSNEVFNALNYQRLMPFIQDVCSGEVGMDEYANTLVESQYNALQKTKLLLKNCSGINGFNFSTQLDSKDLSKQEFSWKAEVMGLADKFRIEWINSFQDDYCREHSKDHDSCKASAEKFCDLMTHEGGSKEDFNRRMSDRVCEYHIQAPQRFKHVTSPLLDAKCKQKIYSKHFNTALLGSALATFSAIVVSRIFNNFC